MKEQAFSKWVNCVAKDESGILATVLEIDGEGPKGDRMFIAKSGETLGTLGDPILDEKVLEQAREKFTHLMPEPKAKEYELEDQVVKVFIDVHMPALKLMIFGAGHDAIPVASFANQCGFRVSVVDPREAFANEERFPNTEHIIVRPENLEGNVAIDDRTLVVIMNHHLDHDRLCLHFAMNSKAPYVGLLGPRKRRDELLEDLEVEGIIFSKEAMSRLYNPIGLNIGAEGADEIAISIVSELIAFSRGESGGPLRDQYPDHYTAYKVVD